MAATPSARTPRNAKIPQWSIEAVVPFVRALADLAGPATNARLGQQLGTSPAGGKFRSKVGTARYYGFIEKSGESNVLTPRGEALVGGDEAAAAAARREAVMSTSFGPIIRKFAGREPNESTIAARLADDFGSPEASAAYQAEMLVKAAREAGLISNGRFDAGAIESVPVEITPPEPDSNGAEPRKREVRVPTTQAKVNEPKPREEKPKPEVVVRPDITSPFAPGIQVVVRIDAGGWTPEQVADLIKSLRAAEEAEPAAGS